MATGIIRPNGDYISPPWGLDPSWSVIDDPVTQPTAGDGSPIIADEDDDSEENEYTMTVGPGDVGTVTGLEVWGYMQTNNTLGTQGKLDIRYRVGTGSWSSVVTIGPSIFITWQWINDSWTSLSLSKSDLDDLHVGVSTPTIDKGNTIFLDTLYFLVTYDVATGWPHNRNGVANANIAKINGVPIATIAKINGVA